jgi:hypothetical protein
MSLVDHSGRPLGRKPPLTAEEKLVLGIKTRRMASILRAELPPPQPVNWGDKVVNAGMMLNDQLGDCTIAAAGHAKQTWSAANGSQVPVSDAEILAGYEGGCGYNPADPSTDQGGVEVLVIKYLQTVGLGGMKFGPDVSLDPGDELHIKAAISYLGGCYIGVGLPLTAQNQIVWRLAMDQGGNGAGSWGGHACWVCGWDPDGLIFFSWGALMRMSWDFWAAYCDESYAFVDPAWVTGEKPAPNGFDLSSLQAEIAAVGA